MIFTKNDLLIFDTSSLLDLYRHPIITSKRILECLKEYRNRIWIPSQVKKEFYNNINKAKNVDMYKKFNDSTKKEAKRLEQVLLKYINNYSKSKFSKLSVLENDIKENFLNIYKKIDDYSNSLNNEKELYKNFILTEVDGFFNELFSSNQVGAETNVVELMEILREAELRYRYKIAPGYEDEKTKDGVDKFGDLIVWKEIINKSKDTTERNIYFITSDNKTDWFANYNTVKKEPCKELIEEFNYYTKEKEIKIITMSDFIKILSDGSNESDLEILLELRKNIIIDGIRDVISKFIVESVVELVNNNQLEILSYSPQGIPNGATVGSIEVETFKIGNVNVNLASNIVNYEIDVELVMRCDLEVKDRYTNRRGYIEFNGNVSLNIKRDLSINEYIFIKDIDKNDICINENIIIQNSNYELEDVYTESDVLVEQMQDLEEYCYH